MYQAIKRLFDFICALAGIIGTSPIWLFSIIMTELSDPGPLFYFAKRVGKDNKEFKMWKFRSMRVAKCANEASLRPDQDRIFWWGKMMRRLKIDELPQLLNILNGTMSIVGPRPAAVDQVEITPKVGCVLCEACEFLVGYQTDFLDRVGNPLHCLWQVSAVDA